MIFHQDDIAKLRKSTIKRLIIIEAEGQQKYVPNPLFDDLVKLYKYDILASDRNLTNYFNLLKRVAEIREEIKKEPPIRLITGYDVMGLGIKPGPIISELMSKVEDAQLEGTIKMREDALKYLRDLVK